MAVDIIKDDIPWLSNGRGIEASALADEDHGMTIQYIPTSQADVVYIDLFDTRDEAVVGEDPKRTLCVSREALMDALHAAGVT
jgi:hypothetical protein